MRRGDVGDEMMLFDRLEASQQLNILRIKGLGSGLQ